MRRLVPAILVLIAAPLAAYAQQSPKFYRWVDENGVTHYSDSIPAQYADQPKEVVDDQGISRDQIAGKKTQEELEAEERAAEIARINALQRRADETLLVTYQNVKEIERHRDRRVELFQAQSRVTELYLRNQRRALDALRRDARRYKPYSSDPNAPMVDQDLVDAIEETEALIERHENNLREYQEKEREIVEEFDGDIERFRELKGITLTASQTSPPQPVPE